MPVERTRVDQPQGGVLLHQASPNENARHGAGRCGNNKGLESDSQLDQPVPGSLFELRALAEPGGIAAVVIAPRAPMVVDVLGDAVEQAPRRTAAGRQLRATAATNTIFAMQLPCLRRLENRPSLSMSSTNRKEVIQCLIVISRSLRGGLCAPGLLVERSVLRNPPL